MSISSPGPNPVAVALGRDDLSCIIDALEGTTHLDTTDKERNHRARLLERLYCHSISLSDVIEV